MRCFRSILPLLVGLFLVPATFAMRTQDSADAGPVLVPAARQATHVAVLTIEGEIDRMTLRSLERRIREAIDDGAGAIALDINTPGGAVGPALDICHLLKTDAPSNSVAWINPQGYSAGTIIALACSEIVTAPNATFGDAAPIVAPLGMLMTMPATERAKIEAPILEEVVDSARRQGYDENLVRSFVAVGVELWIIEHVETGQRVFVDRTEYEIACGEPPPDQITSLTPDPDAAPVTPWINRTIPLPGAPPTTPAAPPPTPNAGGDDEIDLIEAAQTMPPVRDRLTEADRGKWTLLTQVVANDELLTLKPQEAEFFGLSQGTIKDDKELMAYFGAKTLTRYDRSWSESMVRFLTRPVIMGILIVILLVCGFIEMAAPGLGIFGAVALAALGLLIGAPFLAGMAQWWEVLLIGAGLVLVAAEIFIIPGMGVAGLAGAAALLCGVVGLFITNDIASAPGQTELVTGLITTLTAVFAGGVGIWLVGRHVHSLPMVEQLILRTEVGGRPEDLGLLAAMGTTASAVLERNAVGVAVTDLRPAGRAEFDGKLHDVTTTGSFVVKGARVRVVRADGLAIEVEDVEE